MMIVSLKLGSLRSMVDTAHQAVIRMGNVISGEVCYEHGRWRVLEYSTLGAFLPLAANVCLNCKVYRVLSNPLQIQAFNLAGKLTAAAAAAASATAFSRWAGAALLAALLAAARAAARTLLPGRMRMIVTY